MKYYISKIINATFEQAVQRLTESLNDEDFGIISEIDIQEKMKEKLQIDFRRYLILGVCNPSFAYQALSLENKIGTLLPCNVIIQEIFDKNIEIAATDPMVAVQAIGNERLLEIAQQVKNKLTKAVNNVF